MAFRRWTELVEGASVRLVATSLTGGRLRCRSLGVNDRLARQRGHAVRSIPGPFGSETCFGVVFPDAWEDK